MSSEQGPREIAGMRTSASAASLRHAERGNTIHSIGEAA